MNYASCLTTLACLALCLTASTSPASADAINCNFKVDQIPGEAKIKFRYNQDNQGKVSIEADNYATRHGVIIRIGNALYIMDSDGDASSSTILVENGDVEDEWIGARSTIVTIGHVNIRPSVMTSQGTCKVAR